MLISSWPERLLFFFFYWQAPCPYIFIISFCIQYLCVNLGHRSPRVMSWGTCVGWSVWLLGHIFGMPPLLLPGLEPASPGTPTVLTRVRCLSLKPDMDREVRSHPDSRISAKVQSWELGLSRVLRPDDHRNHPELRHVSSLHYRLRHQSCQMPCCLTQPIPLKKNLKIDDYPSKKPQEFAKNAPIISKKSAKILKWGCF